MRREFAAVLEAGERYALNRSAVDARFAAVTGPTKDLIIFMTPRSGSTWLAEILAGHGGFGHPAEWFNPNDYENHFAVTESASLGRYMRHIRASTKDTITGIFSAKLTFHHFDVADRLSPFFEVFDPERTQFVYLTRRDMVAQAVSAYKSLKSGLWHSSQGECQMNDDAIEFSAVELMIELEKILFEEHAFEALFAEVAIRPMRLVYEDMIAAGAERVSQLFCDRLGVRFNATPKTGLQKLATPQNETFAQRLAAMYDLDWLRNRSIMGAL